MLRSRQFTIRGLMLLVAACAVAIACLFIAIIAWEPVLFYLGEYSPGPIDGFGVGVFCVVCLPVLLIATGLVLFPGRASDASETQDVASSKGKGV